MERGEGGGWAVLLSLRADGGDGYGRVVTLAIWEMADWPSVDACENLIRAPFPLPTERALFFHSIIQCLVA